MPILLGGQAAAGVAAVWADDAPAQVAAQPATPSITGDAAAQAEFSSFLRDYHQALLSGNTKFLAAHTNFPLPIAEIVTSPLTRCRQTVAPLAAARGLEPVVEDDLAVASLTTTDGSGDTSGASSTLSGMPGIL